MDTLSKSIIIIITYIVVSIPHVSYSTNTPSEIELMPEVDSLIILAEEHHMWAARHYKVHGMLDSAIVRARLALDIREQLWKENPNINLGKSYHNLGTFLKEKGDYKLAKKYLKEAVSVFTKIKHDRLLRSLLELGKTYKLEGDYVSAEGYFKDVINIAEKKKIDPKIRAAVVDLASIYLDSYQDSLNMILLEKYMDYFDVNNQKDKNIICRFYNNLASIYMRNDKFDKAISTFLIAAPIDTSDFMMQAKIYSNLGLTYRIKGNYPKCYSALKKGKFWAYKSQNPKEMAFSHWCMAESYKDHSKYELSLSECQKAIMLLLPSFSPKNDYENPSAEDLNFIVNKINLLSYFSDKVKVLVNIGTEKSKNEILDLLRLGDLLIDDIRSDHFINETKLYWRSVAFPFYEEALKYCHNEKAYEDAFYFFEKSKAVILLEGYSFNEAISKTSEKDKEKYHKLKESISLSQMNVGAGAIDTKVNSQRSFENFIDSLSVKYPHKFKGSRDLFLLSLSQFQKDFVKDSSSLFVHYFYGKEKVFAFSIESSNYGFFNLGSAHEFDSLITTLKGFFHHPAQIDNDFTTYKKVSNHLFEKLLAPIIKETHKELIISPDGPISFIPFESLISNYSDEQEVKYVIEDRSVRYSFSGSILSNMKDSETRGKYDVVAFEPFSEDESLKEVNFSGVYKSDFGKSETQDLRVKYYSGYNANVENLFSMEGSSPILHFSSHGFEEEGKEPRILLSNSSITLSELYTSFLPSDMVFLSACRTNLGENSYGEGIQSMARGFTFAGANSVISSLWNVIADPNSKIVNRFYKNLSLGQTKHMALHNAKLSYLDDPEVPLFEKSPYYWAGLVYYGESDHILKPESGNYGNSILNFCLVGLLFLLSFLGLRHYMKE